MKKHLLALCILAGTSDCTADNDISHMPPGKYEKIEKHTDANGTTTEQRTSTEVDEDAYGNKKAVIQSETTKDPQGLFNKSTISKTTDVIEENNNQ